jgi:hypothetical protein
MDYERRLANLMPLLDRRAHMEHDVPFREIEPFHDESSPLIVKSVPDN